MKHRNVTVIYPKDVVKLFGCHLVDCWDPFKSYLGFLSGLEKKENVLKRCVTQVHQWANAIKLVISVSPSVRLYLAMPALLSFRPPMSMFESPSCLCPTRCVILSIQAISVFIQIHHCVRLSVRPSVCLSMPGIVSVSECPSRPVFIQARHSVCPCLIISNPDKSFYPAASYFQSVLICQFRQ